MVVIHIHHALLKDRGASLWAHQSSPTVAHNKNLHNQYKPILLLSFLRGINT